MNKTSVGVVGAGDGQRGIAQVFAQAGFDVRLIDVAQPMLDGARRTIDASLAKFVEKGRLTAEARDRARAGISTATSSMRSSALPMSSRRSSRTSRPSRRSSAASTRCSRRRRFSRPTPRRSRSPGSAPRRSGRKRADMHFMNPVPLMGLVELVRGQADKTMRTASGLCVALGKTGVRQPTIPGSSPTVS